MTTNIRKFKSTPLLPENYFVAGSLFAESPEGGVVVVQGPSSLVWAAHVILQMHGFTITPRAGHFWGPDEISVWPHELESVPLHETVTDLINEGLTGTERARAMYFYDYRS